MKRIKLSLFLAMLLVAAGFSTAHAESAYLTSFLSTYPSAMGSQIDSCFLCHQVGYALNPYGTAYANAGHAFAPIEPLDSDGDGYTNIVEIQNLTFPGDPTSHPDTVPNVVGQTQTAATTAITGAGLALGTVTSQSSATVPSGSVISQNPAPGTIVAPGSADNLVVSSGPAPVSVPNEVGQTQAAAIADLTSAGLTYTVTTQSSATVPPGSIISQNPAAGTTVAYGSADNLVVSSGPAPVSVPNEAGQTQAAAIAALTAAGLEVGTITTQPSATVPPGSVISQNPAAGTAVASGSTDNLVVSSGPTTVSVPNEVGQTQAAAIADLTAAGLTYAVTTQSSATVPPGSVISQNPAAGTAVVLGSADNLVVSSGSGSPNQPPVADAGLDMTVLPGTFNVLSGSYSTDSDDGIASYFWTQTGGPAVNLSDPTAMDPVFQAPLTPATLTFTLTVTDNGALQSSASVSVVVLPPDGPPQPPPANEPPVANAGIDQTVKANSKVTLSGAASTDPNGGVLSYSWQQISGPSVKLSGANSVKAAFVAPSSKSSSAELTFQLTVTDTVGLSSTAVVTITVAAGVF